MLGQLCGCFKGSGPHAAASSSVPQVGSAATPASSTQQAGSSTALATKDASSPSHAVQAASSSTQGDSASAAATPEQLACSLQYVLQQPADKQFEALQEQEVVNKLDQVCLFLNIAQQQMLSAHNRTLRAQYLHVFSAVGAPELGGCFICIWCQ